MCLTEGHFSNLRVLAFSNYVALGTASSACAAMFMSLGPTG